MNLNVEKILIIGLGMIGSSIALASKSRGIKVFGFDKSNNSIKQALEKNIIDSSLDSIDNIHSSEFLKEIDLIVIAVPPKQTLEVLKSLKNIWNTNVTITDTSSVKNHIKLDDVTNIVLSHPIAGSDQSGISAANENLFKNKKNVLCDPFNSAEGHFEKVENF